MNGELKFGKRLAELRKEKGLSQKQLADLLDGYSRYSVSDWEARGKQPNYQVLIQLVKILEKSEYTLYFLS